MQIHLIIPREGIFSHQVLDQPVYPTRMLTCSNEAKAPPDRMSSEARQPASKRVKFSGEDTAM